MKVTHKGISYEIVREDAIYVTIKILESNLDPTYKKVKQSMFSTLEDWIESNY